MDNKKMRLGLYRKIEIARDQLPDMDEESFRQRLETSFGVRSRTELSIHQLSQLVHDFAVKDGVVYTVVRNWIIQGLYLMGLPAERLVKHYYKGWSEK